MATLPVTLTSDSTLAEINQWVSIIAALEPLALPVITGFVELLKKHPEVTLDQWIKVLSAVGSAVHTENQDTRDTVKQDQIDHPLPPEEPPAPLPPADHV